MDEFYALALKKKKKKTQLFSVICEGQHSMAMVEKKKFNLTDAETVVDENSMGFWTPRP